MHDAVLCDEWKLVRSVFLVRQQYFSYFVVITQTSMSPVVTSSRSSLYAVLCTQCRVHSAVYAAPCTRLGSRFGCRSAEPRLTLLFVCKVILYAHFPYQTRVHRDAIPGYAIFITRIMIDYVGVISVSAVQYRVCETPYRRKTLIQCFCIQSIG